MKTSKLYLSLAMVAFVTSFAFAQESTTGTVDTGTVVTVTTTSTDTSTGTTTTGTDTTTVTPPVITTTGAGLNEDDKDGFRRIRGEWKLINENFGYAKKFFAKGLSGDLLSGSKALITEKNEAIKLLNKELKLAISSSGIIDWDTYAQKFVNIYTTFKTNAVPYINPTKLEAFNKYVDGKIATVKKNLEYRKQMITKKEIAHKKQEALKQAKLEKKAALEKAKLEKKAALEKARLEKKEALEKAKLEKKEALEKAKLEREEARKDKEVKSDSGEVENDEND